MRRLVDEVTAGKDGTINLLGKLRDVAAVDENDRLAMGDERNARGPGEAGQPRQALRARRHIFAVVFIGTRHEKGVDAERLETRAQLPDPIAAELWRRGDLKRLEHLKTQ